MNRPRDIDLNLCLCHVCKGVTPNDQNVCPTCFTPLHMRKTHSLSLTFALTVAAFLFLLPANLLPMMEVTSLGVKDASNLMEGVIYFFKSGSFGIGFIIFFASVFIPVFKIASLFYLVALSTKSETKKAMFGTKLYRLIHFIGKWSMLDIFVIALMVSIIQFNNLVRIHTGPAAICFAAAVVLTMLATHTFDPRLLWDFNKDD